MLGVGLSVYLDVTPFSPNAEHAPLDVNLHGRRTTRDGAAGGAAIGQGHHTTWAALVGRELGVDPATVRLVEGDTATVPRGWGSASARSVQTAGPALHAARGEVRDRPVALAADLLEAAPADVELVDGRFVVRGVPARSVGWSDLADPDLAGDAALVLRAESDFTPPGVVVPVRRARDGRGGRHRDRGSAVVRHVAVDDCGTAIVPWLVAGQQHGGAVQGIGEALWEVIVVDPDGTPRSTNLVDYGIPGPADLPALTTVQTATPTPHNVLGAKGIGQSGAIGAPAAVLGAVVDALAHLGVDPPRPPATRASRAGRRWRRRPPRS